MKMAIDYHHSFQWNPLYIRCRITIVMRHKGEVAGEMRKKGSNVASKGPKGAEPGPSHASVPGPIADGGAPSEFIEVDDGNIHPSGVKAIDSFTRHLLTLKRSPHTVKTYTLIVKDLLRGLPKAPAEISQNDVMLYQQVLALERGYSKNSLYTAVEALVAFFDFIGSDAAARLARPKRSMAAPRFISEDETHRLLEAANARGERDFLLIAIMAFTGVRVAELCGLRPTDLDVKSRTLLVRSGKGDRDRLVVVPEVLMCRIVSYTREKPDEFLFPGEQGGHLSTRTVQRVVSECAAGARIAKEVTPHVLRHTFATTILRRGGDIRFIQQLLGHRSVATTQIYTHVDDSMIRNMYDKFGPEY